MIRQEIQNIINLSRDEVQKIIVKQIDLLDQIENNNKLNLIYGSLLENEESKLLEKMKEFENLQFDKEKLLDYLREDNLTETQKHIYFEGIWEEYER